jgi:hypothetical protein
MPLLAQVSESARISDRPPASFTERAAPRRLRQAALALAHRALLACGLLAAAAAGCSSGGGYMPPPEGADLSTPEAVDMVPSLADLNGGGGKDGGSSSDGGGGTDLARPGDLAVTPDAGTDLPCTPSVYRCGPANSVQICNSTGTAWLHVSTCSVSCSMGLCTGGCAPKARRCNVKSVEECNATGTAWSPVETCSASCYKGACTLASLDVTGNRDLDGEVVVSGDVIIRSGVTVNVPSGELVLRARQINVENGATIRVASNGRSPEGRGGVDSRYRDESGGGGGYGTAGSRGGSSGASNPGGPAFGSDFDMEVTPGAPGADSSDPAGGGGRGGVGGGVLRFFADSDLTFAGTLSVFGAPGSQNTASYKGGGGGGSGGGVLLVAGDKLTVSGTIDTKGGAGGKSYYSDPGGAGGLGRIKLLYANGISTTGATLNGKLTQGLVPPVLITSSSHPEPERVYNDGFDRVELSWNNPVSSRQGYYVTFNPTRYAVPTPATGSFLMTESHSVPASATSEGLNYFHIVTVDAMFKPSPIEARFSVQINKAPPTLRSSSHPTQTTWYANKDAFFSWTFPVSDSDVRGVHYILDQYADTIPSKTDAFIPLPQKQLVRGMLADGIWFLHVIAQDSRGYLTKQAAHYRVNIGSDPGTGVAIGQVTDMAGKPIDGASVTLNRGLQTVTTNTSGNYNFPMVPAGTFELRASKAGYMSTVKTITVTKGSSTNTGIVLN